MGTLSSQPERQYRTVSADALDDALANAVQLSKKHHVSVSEVIAMNHVLELNRQNDLYVANGDVFDEQMAGFGDLVQALVSAIESLRQA